MEFDAKGYEQWRTNFWIIVHVCTKRELWDFRELLLETELLEGKIIENENASEIRIELNQVYSKIKTLLTKAVERHNQQLDNEPV